MKAVVFILSVVLLASCGGAKKYPEEVKKLDSLLVEVKSAQETFNQIPSEEINSRLDSIQSTIEFLKNALGDEITFDDGLILDDYRATKSIVKKFGKRTAQIKVEFKRTESQLLNFIEALSNGASEDSNGEAITDEYVKQNMKLETTAAENLINSVNELSERSSRFIKANEEKLNALSPVIERFK